MTELPSLQIFTDGDRFLTSTAEVQRLMLERMRQCKLMSLVRHMTSF